MGGKMLGTSRKRPRTTKQYKTTTVRQFDGGWNAADNEFTLSPKYATVFDNMQRGSDASVSVRYGYALWKDLKTGTSTPYTQSVTLTTTNTSRRVVVNWTAHPFLDYEHVTFSGLTTYQGINASYLNKTHSVRKIDANSFDIVTEVAATGAGTSGAMSATVTRDTHLLGGSIVDGIYFQDSLIIVSSIGEVFSIDSSGTATRIWANPDAYAISGSPASWSATDFVSFHAFGGVLLIHNGIDKPLDVDLTRTPKVIFLGDPASGGSNADVPIGTLGLSSGGFAIIGGQSAEPSLLSFSAGLASGVYSGNPAPDDATDIDLSKTVNTSDSEITGLAELRGKLLVFFRNAIAIGELGEHKTVGSTEVHDPQFKDSIPQYGTVSHRTIVALGDDVLVCDRLGVPSVSQSLLADRFTPERISDAIEPAIQKNLSRLSEDTLRLHAFAVYNPQDKQYMLFMPKYDAVDTRTLESDPIIFVDDLEDDEFILKVSEHGFDIGDRITLAGATDIGANPASAINGTRTVSAIIDKDYVVISTGAAFTTSNIQGGGTAVTAKPVNDETIAYVYTFNQRGKIKAWARFKGLNFDCGIKTPNGFLYFGKGGKLYKFGSKQYPYYADQVGDYDYAVWATSTLYPEGTRVYDISDRKVYKVTVGHTSASSGSFAQDRAARDYWEEYKGEPIDYTWEWPWGDFDKRMDVKQIGAVQPDATGKGQFTVDLFGDLLYKGSNGRLTPLRSLQFSPTGMPGFGAGTQPYGSGRRVKEQAIWAAPIVCKLYKVRIEGSTTDPLSIVALTLIYKEGSMTR